jgi:hypothetical protein
VNAIGPTSEQITNTKRPGAPVTLGLDRERSARSMSDLQLEAHRDVDVHLGRSPVCTRHTLKTSHRLDLTVTLETLPEARLSATIETGESGDGI